MAHYHSLEDSIVTLHFLDSMWTLLKLEGHVGPDPVPPPSFGFRTLAQYESDCLIYRRNIIRKIICHYLIEEATKSRKEKKEKAKERAKSKIPGLVDTLQQEVQAKAAQNPQEAVYISLPFELGIQPYSYSLEGKHCFVCGPNAHNIEGNNPYAGHLAMCGIGTSKGKKDPVCQKWLCSLHWAHPCDEHCVDADNRGKPCKTCGILGFIQLTNFI